MLQVQNEEGWPHENIPEFTTAVGIASKSKVIVCYDYIFKSVKEEKMKFKKSKMLVKGGVAAVSVAIIITVINLLGIEGINEATVTGIVSGVVLIVACVKNWIKNR